MRIGIILIALCATASSCGTRGFHARPEPVATADNLTVPGICVLFRTPNPGWEAYLLTAVQPLPLVARHKDGQLAVWLRPGIGVIEGAAQIVLSSGAHHFLYPVCLANRFIAQGEHKDYRSPKTLNPDSSLIQHRMVHRIGPFRNLMPLNAGAILFMEQSLGIPSKAGTYRADPTSPLSSFYVQPGSATSILLKAKPGQNGNGFHVQAGPMKDKHGNTVADGTIVAFIYQTGLRSHRLEALVNQGIARAFIPLLKDVECTLVAEVNETFSEPVNLILNK